MRLYMKVGLSILLVLVVCFGLIGFLAYYKFVGTVTALTQSKLEVVTRDVRNSAEVAVKLGLPLDQASNLRDVLRDAATRDQGILYLSVFATTEGGSSILYHVANKPEGAAAEQPASQLKEGDKLPEVVAQAFARRGADGFRLTLPDELVIGSPIENKLGRVVGGVTLAYGKAAIAAQAREFLRDLVIGAAGSLLIGLLLTFPLCYLALRRLSVGLSRLESRLKGDGEVASSGLGALDSVVARFDESVARARAALDQAEEELDQLGGGPDVATAKGAAQ